MSDQQERQFAAKCPHCQARLRVQSADLGTRRTCPSCKKIFAIPAGPTPADSTNSARAGLEDWQPPVEIPVVCRVCQTRYYGRPEQAGAELACPDCGVDNRVSSLAARSKPKFIGLGQQEDIRLHEGVDQPQESQNRQFGVKCEICDSVIYCRRQHVGKRIRCPDCGSVVTIPEPPPPKPDSSIKPVDPGIGIRPAAETEVFKTNADSLLAKAAAKYHEAERKRPVPPQRPFIDGVWTFPFHLEVLPILIVIAFLGCLIPYVVQMALQTSGLGLIIGLALFTVVSLLSLATFFVATNSFMTIVSTTAMGFSKIEWQKFEVLEGIKTAILFFTSLAMSLGPGTSLGLMLRSPNAAIVALPFAFVVFPFVFLSMLDAGSAVIPFTPYIWSTLSTDRRAWVKFYLASLPVFSLIALPHAIILALQTSHVLPVSFPWLTFFYATVTSTTIGSLVYFRLVGRLAWVINYQIPVDIDERTEAESKEDVAVTT